MLLSEERNGFDTGRPRLHHHANVALVDSPAFGEQSPEVLRRYDAALLPRGRLIANVAE